MSRKKFISIIWGYSETFHSMDISENYHLHILKIAKDMGYSPIILVNDKKNLENDPNLDRDIEIIEHKKLFDYVFKLIKYSLQNSVFYVNSCEIKSYIVPIFTRRAIFMGHTQPKRSTLAKQLLQDISFKLFKAIRLNNEEEKSFLLKRGVKEKKLFVAPLVVSQKIFKFTNNSNRKDLVYFGHVTKTKNIITILKALKEILKIRPEIKLRIIGNIWDKDFYKEIEELELNKSVIVHGFMPQDKKLSELLNSTLVSLNSSKSEGQCVAVYDTALCGNVLCLPKIMSFVGVFDKCALFHDVYDHNTLAKNILHYLDNPAMIVEYQSKCIDLIKKKYSKEVVETKIRQLITKI